MIFFVVASASLNILAALYLAQPHVRGDFVRWLTPARKRDNRVINIGLPAPPSERRRKRPEDWR